MSSQGSSQVCHPRATASSREVRMAFVLYLVGDVEAFSQKLLFVWEILIADLGTERAYDILEAWVARGVTAPKT